MYLKRLEIQGFKSFAQKTTLEFGPGVIAVVGPNGSGKSNVADSIRWVLGEQSAKMIRGKKADDVIFAGSDKKVRLGFAEVSATFDNSDRRIPLDTAEVSIGRRVDRSGESEYLLNGNIVRLLDIVDLVLKSNIGTSRYTVIGQGTIDQMILQGPSEVKNLLDEASGVKSYYMKRDKTLRRLEQTAQNLMRAEDLIAEIEPRLKSLRRQAKKMEARAEIEQELKIYQREFFGHQFFQLKTELDKFNGELEVLNKNKDGLQAEIAQLSSQTQVQEASRGNSFSMFRQIQDSLSQLQNQKNHLLENLSLIRGKMQSHKSAGSLDGKSLQINLHQLEGKERETFDSINQAQKNQQQQNQILSGAKNKLAELNAKLDKLYSFLQNPSTVDWQGFNFQLQLVEQSVQEFYTKIESGKPWEEVKTAINAFRQRFAIFKNFATKSFSDPAAAANLQQQLQASLKAKEELAQQIQSLELELSKSNITLEFLAKEQSRLSQEKLQVQIELKKLQSSSEGEFVKDLIIQEQAMQKEVEGFSKKILDLESLFVQEQKAQEGDLAQLRQAESALRGKQDEVGKVKDQVSTLAVEKAKLDTQMSILAEEVQRILGMNEWQVLPQTKEENKTADLEDKIMRLRNQLETIGGMDELTLKEYQETEARHTNLSKQVNDLKQGMNDLRQIIEELDMHIKQRFNESFHIINEKFEYYFRVLFNGGRAYLSVLRSEEEQGEIPMDEESRHDQEPKEQLRPEEKVVKKYEKGANNVIGIDIKATPPGKKLASIQALSGGERALTSIALLCSLLSCFPSPFVVLDEVDAALDDANTIRFGQILGTLAHQTQFVTITHNRETMAQASMIYGVTMGDDGISKLLSVKLEQAKAYAK